MSVEREEKRSLGRTVRGVGGSSGGTGLSSGGSTRDTRRGDIGDAIEDRTTSAPAREEKRGGTIRTHFVPPNAKIINNVVPTNSPTIAIKWFLSARLAGPCVGFRMCHPSRPPRRPPGATAGSETGVDWVKAGSEDIVVVGI